MATDDPEREPTPEEEREALALAAALDAGPSAPNRDAATAPEEALAAAGLARSAHDGGLLPDDRRDAVLARVLADEKRARPRRVLRWVAAPVALAAAAALAFVVLRPDTDAMPAVLPRPSARVLDAQLAVARGGDPRVLDDSMRAYRRDVYSALRRRYRGAR